MKSYGIVEVTVLSPRSQPLLSTFLTLVFVFRDLRSGLADHTNDNVEQPKGADLSKEDLVANELPFGNPIQPYDYILIFLHGSGDRGQRKA